MQMTRHLPLKLERGDCEMITPLIVKHFARWSRELHVGFNGNNSKFVVLIRAKSQRCYMNPINYDSISLSPIS